MAEEHVPGSEGTPGWLRVAVAVLAVVSLLALGVAWNGSQRAQSAEQGLVADVKAVKQNLDQYVEVLSKRLEQAEAANAKVQGELSVVTKRLKLTRGELAKAREQAEQVVQIREEYAKQLGQMETSVKSELAAKASADDVKILSGDVSGIRTDLEATKQNFQMARGELGTLIARNREEIEQLRRLGERDYFEFTLDGKGSQQKIADILVELRGTNTKRNHFTVALHVNDLRLEKKNRAINEPIYFYTRGIRAPLEMVVNQVAKNKIVGYLSVPKVRAGTAGA